MSDHWSRGRRLAEEERPIAEKMGRVLDRTILLQEYEKILWSLRVHTEQFYETVRFKGYYRIPVLSVRVLKIINIC